MQLTTKNDELRGWIVKDVGRDIFDKRSKIISKSPGALICSNDHPYALPLRGIYKELGNFWYESAKNS